MSLAHDVAEAGLLLVAVHGITEDRRSWDRVPLADHFRTVRVDLRGHGDSPRVRPYDPSTLAADVHEPVAALAPDEQPLVVGHSCGAVVATAYASRYRARGVVDVDQTLDVTSLPPVVEAVRGEGSETFITGLFDQLYGQLDPAVAQDLRDRRRVRQDVLLGVWAPLLDLGPEALARWMEDIMPAPLPYLSLHGSPPSADHPAWLDGRIPGALVEDAPVTTHYPHLADPAWFLRRLVAFDASIPPVLDR